MDKAADAWHSGHVNDVIEFADRDGVIIATETGGVWLLSEVADPLPLSSTWDNPDVKCLALRPDGPRHVFAGCTVAYDSKEKRSFKPESGSSPVIMESEAAALLPLLAWNSISGALPATAGRITRIVVIRNLRRIVVACAQVRNGDTGGIFWAKIPETRFAPGDPPREAFVWQQAKVSDAPTSQGFWDLAVGAIRDDVTRDNLEDRGSITLVAGGFGGGGLAVGRWDSADELIFKRPSVLFDDNTDASALLFDSCGTSSVSSCEVHPTTLYAACAWPDGTLNSVLRSKDGGLHWNFCPARLAGGGPFDLVAPALGDQGRNWNNCISAHPQDAGTAALGWQFGPYLTSDGGTTWRVVEGAPHLHADVHALHFAIEAPNTIGSLFVGSDGGVAKVNLLDDPAGVNGPPVQSNFNRQLATLQCYSMLIRQFAGTVDICAEFPGLLAAGLQDNGNVSSSLRPSVEPWQHVDGGDGGWNSFVLGGYVHNFKAEATLATAPLGPAVQVATIPVTLPAPGNPAGLQVVVGEPVATPTQRNPSGDLLVAVGAANASSTLFGLYSNNSVVPPYQWQQIGAIPSNETISALASVSGDRVLVGTGQGKIYAFDTATGASTGQSIKLPKPSPSTHMAGGALLRIVSFDSDSIFAVLLGATETRDDGTQFLGSPAVQRYILRLSGNDWKPTASVGLPNELIYGFVAVDAPNTEVLRGLLAATDDAVYISRDDGQNWRRASQGLPVRPHCGDLRFALDRLGEANIVLGTFGRSMWTAHLG
jgi:hypothetical protein